MHKPQEFYYVEFTDTFGGEANYCWIRRYKVKAASMRGAILKAARDMGYSGRIRKTGDFGDMVRHDVRGAAVCAFTQWFDEDSHKHESCTEL